MVSRISSYGKFSIKLNFMFRTETKYLVAVDVTKLKLSNKYTYIQ